MVWLIARGRFCKVPALLALLIGGACMPAGTATASPPEKVDFARVIRPILAEHCFACHGFDEKKRKAKLRLDERPSALARKAIVPGDPRNSKLIARIEATEATEQMPPPRFKKPLSAEQKKLLRTWIEHGADYARHWAFTPPVRPTLPAVKQSSWCRNPIDRFLLERMEREGLTPSPEADKETLIRRLTLDLTGLPPTPGEVDAFLADTSANAYEKVVDRLLASTRHAERMALSWLDAARYADTNGFNNDEDRRQWPWRDWVIDAFRGNMPYDRFLLEQVAGDMLPQAALSQKVATAFHRNQVYNTEGGIIPEEYRVEYVADRVHTTATVFLGLSMQCARCHDHKYDPISQKEYYQFFAFFNSVPDMPASAASFGPSDPFIRVPSRQQRQQLDRLNQTIARLASTLQSQEKEIGERVTRWEKTLTPQDRRKLSDAGLLLRLPLNDRQGSAVTDAEGKPRGTVQGRPGWGPGKVDGALDFDGGTHVTITNAPVFESDTPFSISLWAYPTSNGPVALLSKMDDAAAYRGYDVLLEDGKVAVHLVHHWPDRAIKVVTKNAVSLRAWHPLAVTYDGSGKASGVKVYVDGKRSELTVVNDSLQGSIQTEKALHVGKRQSSLPFKGKLDEVQLFGIELTGDHVAALARAQPAPVGAGALDIPVAKRSAAQQFQVRRLYLQRIDKTHARLQAELAEATRQKDALEKASPSLMIMQELPRPRETFLLDRGQYDQPRQKVGADVPAVLPPLPAGAPRNRLGLARWLVDLSNPLTARVAVNRWWQMIFGTGLVKTVEDFGVTGELPSHPELLDFLATELTSNGWNVKEVLRLIVTSSAYRQSSRMTKVLRERDPENRLLARGARYRLPAELVRDNALAISGLLVERVGGPSVKPYQPAGLWEDVTVNRQGKYVEEKGDNLYRRSLYTFWKRTCPPPALMSFDAPNREVCIIRRAVTNTPLQALVLLNDPTYVEAARKLAARMIRAGGDQAERCLDYGFRWATARMPTEAERKILLTVHAAALARFQASRSAARELLRVGSSGNDPSLDEISLAAWTVVASTILNLDETISRR